MKIKTKMFTIFSIAIQTKTVQFVLPRTNIKQVKAQSKIE